MVAWAREKEKASEKEREREREAEKAREAKVADRVEVAPGGTVGSLAQGLPKRHRLRRWGSLKTPKEQYCCIQYK